MASRPQEHLSDREDPENLDIAQRLEFIREGGDKLGEAAAHWLEATGVGASMTPEQREELIPRMFTILGEAMAEHGADFFEETRFNDLMVSMSLAIGIEPRRHDREKDIDELTGLADVRALNRALPVAEQDKKTAILFIDVNNFGEINKKFSDSTGDVMLKYVADFLKTATKSVVGTSERVFRKGGDEFVILTPKDKAEELRTALKTLFGSLETPVIPDDVNVQRGVTHDKQYGKFGSVLLDDLKVSLSVGVGLDEDTKKDAADAEMQSIKKHLRNIDKRRKIAGAALGGVFSRRKKR